MTVIICSADDGHEEKGTQGEFHDDLGMCDSVICVIVVCVASTHEIGIPSLFVSYPYGTGVIFFET